MNSSTNQLRSSAMQLAWQLIKKAGMAFGEAVRRAYEVIKLKVKLAKTDEKGMWIQYTKEDGTIRHALATRNSKHIPQSKQPKTTGESKVEIAVKYFDILADGWRSFRADRLIIEQA